MMVGSGVPLGPKRTEDGGTECDREEDGGGEDEVLPDRAGHKGNAVLVREFVVLLDVGLAANDAAGHRPFVDAELQHHPDVEAGEGEQRAWDDEDVQRKEARERGAVDDGTAQHQVDKLPADERYAAHDGCADAESPVGVLIEAQHLAGEGHAQRHQQHEDAERSR